MSDKINYKPNYYAVIPAPVRYDKDLSPQAKLIYAEISALSNSKGYCWASNKYFAQLFGITTVTVSRLISQLIKAKYIDTQLNRYSDRKLMLKGGINKNVKPNTN
jgi:DNA-binding MarR family transcriptional regulator